MFAQFKNQSGHWTYINASLVESVTIRHDSGGEEVKGECYVSVVSGDLYQINETPELAVARLERALMDPKTGRVQVSDAPQEASE